MEFFSLSEEEKEEIINNALAAGPTIPFPNFSKLFKTWLEILSSMESQKREEIFSKYIDKVTKSPEKLISFNLDGIWEIFNSLEEHQKEAISQSLRRIIGEINEEKKRVLLLIIPASAKILLEN